MIEIAVNSNIGHFIDGYQWLNVDIEKKSTSEVISIACREK